MNGSTLTIVLLALLVAIVLTGIELYEASQPQYRKGCTECLTAQRRAEEVQRELAHDVEHKGFGFRPGAPDRYSCHDEGCWRNPRRPQDPQ